MGEDGRFEISNLKSEIDRSAVEGGKVFGVDGLPGAVEGDDDGEADGEE
jgi:hypothetical protein